MKGKILLVNIHTHLKIKSLTHKHNESTKRKFFFAQEGIDFLHPRSRNELMKKFLKTAHKNLAEPEGSCHILVDLNIFDLENKFLNERGQFLWT